MFKVGDIVGWINTSADHPFEFWFGRVTEIDEINPPYLVTWFIAEPGNSGGRFDEASIRLATAFEIAKLRKMGYV